MSEDGECRMPDGFVWGTATASYQTEGGWNEEGKSESIWDAFTHGEGRVSDGNNGDVACDSYHKFDDDIAMMTELGIKSYRMSISWPRIIPDPFSGDVNPEGVAFYNRMIDSLLANGISPCVTLYHWDMPQVLEEKVGGWPKEEIIPYFVRYAEACFAAFGDKVKTWITFNEPSIFIVFGYVIGYHAPGRTDMAEQGPYACVHNVVRAHAQVYRLYQEKFKPFQKGQVGLAFNSDWAEPLDPRDPVSVTAADRALQFRLGAYAHPIFVDGDYPPGLKERLAGRGKGGTSRLPAFTPQEKEYIKGSADFFGLNYYTTRYITPGASESEDSYQGDLNIEEKTDPQWKRGRSVWLYSVPWGLRKLLNHIKDSYGSPPVYITENGFSDPPGTMEDKDRVDYITHHLHAVHGAISDGVDVRGYYCWTLMDNFEWAEGYNERFGLYHVDFTDPQRKRTAKESARFFHDVVTTNRFTCKK